MYGSVPVTPALMVALGVATTRANPKSTMRAELSLVMMMFDGLISRCTMFRACAAASPAAIWQTQSIACRKASGPPFNRCESVCPS